MPRSLASWKPKVFGLADLADRLPPAYADDEGKMSARRCGE
jgi:hypothetical protein